MVSPKYEVGGSAVYLRESAAIGILEAVKISGAHLGPSGWLYSINATLVNPGSAAGQTDRRSLVSNQQIYYSEDELIALCDALVLVEASTKAAYERARAQRQTFCPDEPTLE